jgi:BirA family biotin operon repressor/biotin-[acetyl-CoA-carboxylase] ligase
MIIGSEIIFRKNLPSTNTYVLQILKSQRPKEGTIIYTNYQSAGRGQSGNGWESEDGMNLLFSVLIFPTTVNPAEQFLISMAISLGICDFLARYIPQCYIKWPNDIYVNNDKIAGILIENTIMGNLLESCVAGVGLNVNQVKFTGNAPNPVSMKAITGKDYNVEFCLNEVASDLDRRYKQLLSENFGNIRDEYKSKLFRLNEWADYRDQNGIYRGRIVSVSDYGHLQVEKQPGTITEYTFKEIEFIL